MPILRQSKKALRQSIKRAARNKRMRDSLAKSVKLSRKALVGKTAEAAALVKDAVKKLDKAAQKGLVKKNTAARKKSRLMKKLNSLGK